MLNQKLHFNSTIKWVSTCGMTKFKFYYCCHFCFSFTWILLGISYLSVCLKNLPHLVIVSKCSFQVMEIVIVCLLQMMSYSRKHSPFPVTPSKIISRNTHVDQVSCSIFIRFNHYPKGMIWWDPEGVFNWIVYLAKLRLGSLTEIVNTFWDNLCCLFSAQREMT